MTEEASLSMTVDAVNALDETGFVSRFGDIAEDSPWVAEVAFAARPFADREAVIEAFAGALRNAAPALQMELLCAHPDLAGRAALAGDLARASAEEQAQAGLDRLSREEFDRFHALNDRYRRRFGFPFIFAVKGATKQAVIAAFERRIDNDIETERSTALAQVERIFRFRIEDRVVQ
ncbi:2-oxo-4-hydroxy-4-carboxy-5-ureidoimidazoline decarboxylase [Thioalkalivibrio sp. HK1]|uniref:2-oxo-4-hydroxy-4-carboxy-5-ureidoimidazoline decarboxylase n=1 Tax=Thioalkalivibrio sp. HK1 TaxID=1469245 RepID=UPI0004BA7FC1|nr:2-oxo-4-hydroxy-4-carboxy-5-ureidoimidazoline decarboxylase [Thioalkalivibrio sp. HK1]